MIAGKGIRIQTKRLKVKPGSCATRGLLVCGDVPLPVAGGPGQNSHICGIDVHPASSLIP